MKENQKPVAHHINKMLMAMNDLILYRRRSFLAFRLLPIHFGVVNNHTKESRCDDRGAETHLSTQELYADPGVCENQR